MTATRDGSRQAGRAAPTEEERPMHYLLFYDVVPNYVTKRIPLRSAHLEHAQRAVARGELLLGGALADPVDGAVLLFTGSSAAVAAAFAEADPYVRNGLVTAWRVREWTTVVGPGAAGAGLSPTGSHGDQVNAEDLLRDLFRHMEWADALVWKTVRGAPQATGDSGVRQRLHHIHLVQRAFLLIWRGQPMEFKSTESFTLDELAKWGHDYHREVAGFLGTLGSRPLESPVHLPWASHIVERFGTIPSDVSFAETLMQVTAHSAYHRGQVNARLRELGVEPPLTDFIGWVWFGKPAPEWPSGTE